MNKSIRDLVFILALRNALGSNNLSVESEILPRASQPQVIHSTKYAQVTFDAGIRIHSSDPRWGGLFSLITTSDARRWIGISTKGGLVSGAFQYDGSKLSGVARQVNLTLPQDAETGEVVKAESMSTISGAPLSDPNRGGFYVRVDDSVMPIFFYPEVNPDEYSGTVFSQQPLDPLSYCPSSIRQELASCPRGYQSIESLPADASESVGSIIFVCEVPFEDDGLLHGWVCNPSTGDSSRFLLGTQSGWTLSDLATCPRCDPGQVFLLSRNETGGFSVDSVLIESLLEESRVIEQADDSVHGRMRLFDASVGSNMQSLALIPDTSESSKVKLFIGSGDANNTVILSFNLAMLPAGSEFMNNAADDERWFSIVVILALLVVGIAIPIAVYKNHKLRSMIDDWKWQKESALLGLNEDEDTLRLRKPVKPIEQEMSVKGKPRLEILIE